MEVMDQEAKDQRRFMNEVNGMWNDLSRINSSLQESFERCINNVNRIASILENRME